MGKLQDLEKQVKEQKEDIKNLYRKIEELKKKENKIQYWKPKNGEKYYVIGGEVLHSCWQDDKDDKYYYDLGNCFKTKEEAEKVAEKIKIYTELKRYAKEHNEELKDGDKCFIYYEKAFGKLQISHCRNVISMFQFYFSSVEIANQAIKEIGEERIKKFFIEEGK